jgi:glyoxylase-like metal-dependent hydrolase (beta-lactamase superfamily II)
VKLHTINTGFFKLDGGAMHGVVPKSIWNKFNPADDKNLCTWAMRCLLIEDGDKLILIDNGIGDKQDFNFFRHYYLHGDETLEKSINKAGFGLHEITDVFLTHLHFDHCGGSVRKNGDGFTLTFPNAHYWSNEAHWSWAINPNKREGASFLKDNILPIKESGQLKFINPGNSSPFNNINILYTDGHTEKQMLPVISYKDKRIVFVADLIPSLGHIPVPYIMSYDVRPLVSIEEKENFLTEAADKNYILFLEHDLNTECCTVERMEKGIRQSSAFKLSEI